MKVGWLKQRCLAVPMTIGMLAGFNCSVFAQHVNGSFHGTVTDTTGAVITGATVEIKNQASGQQRQAITDDKGFYTITEVPPGRYSMTTSKVGFAKTARPEVELEESQDLEVDDALKVGGAEQVVEVTTAPTMLSTASASLGQTIDTQQAQNLPLNGRQFTQLVLLTPGAEPREGGQQNGFTVAIAGGGISPAVNGQRGGENTFTLDGILDNHPYIQVWAISPPPDAIQEFKTQSHMADAEYSFSSGANVNVLTKSGTNQFHGDAYEFIRNDDFDAANYFDAVGHIAKPAYHQNQYGLTVGGPILFPAFDGRKNNTHFFGYWENYKSIQGATALVNAPTNAELGGDFSDLLTGKQATSSTGALLYDVLGRPIMAGAIYNPYSTRTVNGQLVRDAFPNNRIAPTEPLNAAALAYLKALYNTPNYGPGGNSFPNLAIVETTNVTAKQFGAGIDHTFRNNDTFLGKFYYSQPDQLNPTPVKFGQSHNENHAKVITTSYTHLFSPTFLLVGHYGYTWLHFGIYSQPAGEQLAQEVNSLAFVPPANGAYFVPAISIAPRGFTSSGQSTTPMGPDQLHQANVDLQKITGAHTIGFGFLYQHTHAYDESTGGSDSFDQYPTTAITTGNTNVSSTGDGLASMLVDLPSGYQGFFGNTAADLQVFWLGGYVQDKWQVSKKLNVTIGTRWDFQSPPHYKNNQFTMWNSNCPFGTYNTPATLMAIQEQCLLMPTVYTPSPTPSNPNPLTWPKPNVSSSIWASHYRGWEPRFGIAYSATQRTVIRTGFNIFDDHNAFDKEYQDPRSSWPFGGQVIPTSLNRGVPTLFFDQMPSAASFLQGATPVFGRAGNPNAKIPYSIQYNLGVQQQLSPNISGEVNYVGSVSRHLWGTYGYNQPLPQNMGPNAIPAGEPFPFINGTIHADDNLWPSNYNGLQAQLSIRSSHGMTMIASYTYSRCMDEIGGEFDPIPQNTYDLAADYGVCESNLPQLFSFSAVYALPFGRGKQFGNNAGHLMNALIGGWNLTDITSVQTGIPFTVGLAIDNANTGTIQRANYVPGCQLKPSGFQQNRTHWYNPACFVVPPPYTFGDTQRNAYRGPRYTDSDIAMFKSFGLGEQRSFEFRVETFNTFNNTHFSPPGGSPTGAFASIGGTVTNNVATPTFMEILSAAPARQIQLAGRITF